MTTYVYPKTGQAVPNAYDYVDFTQTLSLSLKIPRIQWKGNQILRQLMNFLNYLIVFSCSVNFLPASEINCRLILIIADFDTGFCRIFFYTLFIEN